MICRAALSDTAMVLAAGFGMRMRPLTLEKPKPLIEVGGRTMLDQALDRIAACGIARAVVNTHYLGDQIAAFARTRSAPQIILSPEADILETGGGVKNALEHFGGKPFFVLASDLPLRDGSEPVLKRMAHAWNPDAMDMLLLVGRREKMRGFGASKGDFMMGTDGRLTRKNESEIKSHIYLSAMIVKPELYAPYTQAAFSNNLLFDAAEEQGRLFGIEHDGTCYHVGTPQDLAEAERLLQTKQGWG